MTGHPALPLGPARRLLDLGRGLATWPVTSQHGSRRNAMLAASEITHRRREQREVEEFLTGLRPRRRAATG